MLKLAIILIVIGVDLTALAVSWHAMAGAGVGNLLLVIGLVLLTEDLSRNGGKQS